MAFYTYTSYIEQSRIHKYIYIYIYGHTPHDPPRCLFMHNTVIQYIIYYSLHVYRNLSSVSLLDVSWPKTAAIWEVRSLAQERQSCVHFARRWHLLGGWAAELFDEARQVKQDQSHLESLKLGCISPEASFHWLFDKCYEALFMSFSGVEWIFRGLWLKLEVLWPILATSGLRRRPAWRQASSTPFFVPSQVLQSVDKSNEAGFEALY